MVANMVPMKNMVPMNPMTSSQAMSGSTQPGFNGRCFLYFCSWGAILPDL